VVEHRGDQLGDGARRHVLVVLLLVDLRTQT
jgi:hypothetical protein